MKSRPAAPSVQVPRFMGRSESDMIKHGQPGQLDLFRETLTRPAKVQVIAMLALSDPQRLDRPQEAKVADIARAMGYKPLQRADGKTAFHPDTYKQIEDTGMKLRRRSFDVYVRRPDGYYKDGRRKWKAGIVNLSILQEFGFYYEDEEGNPINLEDRPKDELIKYEAVQGPPLFAIPALDDRGKMIKNKDGTIRRKMANGVSWRFASYFSELAKDRGTSWIVYREAIDILCRYLTKPATFDLIYKTLFWTASMPIEMAHETLIEHLDIRSKDHNQVNRAIDAAFADALKEGVLARPVKVREAGYYKPTEKTGRRRRIGKVYQWARAAKWNPGRNLLTIEMGGMEGYNEGEDEKPKS